MGWFTLPDLGDWKKMVSATWSAVSRAITTGMHSKDRTVIADTQQEMTALGLPSPCACDPNVSSAVETPRRKYQQKLNHCRHTGSSCRVPVGVPVVSTPVLYKTY